MATKVMAVQLQSRIPFPVDDVLTDEDERAIFNTAAEPNREKGLIIFLNNLYN